MSITVTFEANEAAFLLDLLGTCGDKLSCAGCNDFPVPNTDENWALYKKVMAESSGDEIFDDDRPKEGKIYFYDWILLWYLRKRIKAATKKTKLNPTGGAGRARRLVNRITAAPLFREASP